jgi:osmotically-inducible protein OsmY
MHKPNNLLEFDAQEALDWDPQIDDSRIVVSAKDGRVTLTGSVHLLSIHARGEGRAER